MKRLLPIVLILLLAAAFAAPSVSAQDGIPDNCEITNAAHYRANIFPRYEPHNRRLVLVDWSTGQDVQVIAADLGNTLILGWSLDCRYLTGAVGPAESMATTVWDTVANLRVGEVPDAHLQPHYITWGPGNYLVVETRHGAILWNVPANTQVTLTESFDPYTARNFSRLRWDAAAGQLIVNFAVGGRAVYDLASGQEAPEAANPTQSIPASPGLLGSIILGGREYPCQIGYRYGYRGWYTDQGYNVPGIYLRYSFTTQQVYLALYDIYGPDEAIEILEDDVPAAWFQPRGWSANCRYVAASIGVPGEDASDTVVWDVIENRRVGTWPDARQISHPIHWSPLGDYLLIETRSGGYLWHLPTDARFLINEAAEVAFTGDARLNNFHSIGWDSGRGQLLVVPVGASGTVRAHNISDGSLAAEYTPGAADGDARWWLSDDGSRIVVLDIQTLAFSMWDRAANARADLSLGDLILSQQSYFTVAISDSGRYVALLSAGRLRVWDTTSGGAPAYTYETSPSASGLAFADDATLTNSLGQAFNLATGEAALVASSQAPIFTPVEGLSGDAQYFSWWRWADECAGTHVLYDFDARRLYLADEAGAVLQVLAEDINATRAYWSPNCDYVFGYVAMVDVDTPYDSAPLDDIYRDHLSHTITFWETGTGHVAGEFVNPYTYGRAAEVHWSPGGDRALVRTSNGSFVFHPASGASALLVFADYPDGYRVNAFNTYPQVYWDYERGQVLVSGWGAIYAFDMQSGLERARFLSSNPSGRCSFWGCAFAVSADNNFLFFYARRGTLPRSPREIGAVWNLDTLEPDRSQDEED
jgi:hypothetical protein